MSIFNPPKGTREDRDYNAYFDFNGKIVRAVGLANYQELADAIAGEGGERLLEFGEIFSLASSATTELLNITVPAQEIYVIGNIMCSGNRIAIYEFLVDDVVKARRRTWFSNFNAEFNFTKADFTENINLKVRATNNDSKTGDFEATLSGVKR
jgi:hypothetical protein